jgi:DNA-binding XRE family transcriptional regulator
MVARRFGNYLRAHRRRAGLTQRELGQLVGYKHSWAVARHESSQSVPPLLIALAYQEIFRVPITEIFSGMHTTVVQAIEQKLAELEDRLGAQSAKGNQANETAHKLQWLMQRKELA